MCQDPGKRNLQSPFSFFLQKPVSGRHRHSFDPFIPPPEIAWFKTVWLDVGNGQRGPISLWVGWGDQVWDGRRGSIWLSANKIRNRWRRGGALWQCSLASPGRFQEIRKWSSQKNKQRASLKEGSRPLTLCLLSAIWSLASEDGQGDSLLLPDWKPIASAFSLQPQRKTHTNWGKKTTALQLESVYCLCLRYLFNFLHCPLIRTLTLQHIWS